ncbi:MAG: efflux transporter periplasmic adaptor subunit, partial [bacterium]|nr:efflux transporter periplasmic adaptor subunit [bacterium]
NGQVSYQKVELGRLIGNTYEVISGVADGNEVVITGQSRLNNGMEVEIDK